MRRFFFRPTAGKIIFSLVMAVVTSYRFGLQAALPENLQNSSVFVKAGLTFIYLYIGPENPILKFIVLFTFWFLVSWLVYLSIWAVEYAYVKLYNFLVIKIKYTHK